MLADENLSERFMSRWGNEPADPKEARDWMRKNMPFPLWMSADQAERLRIELVAEGFINVKMEDEDGKLRVRVFTGTEDGPEHSVRISNVMDLPNVVHRFKQWRDRNA